MWNLVSSLTPTQAITLQKYRYAGFGFRATQLWTKENSVMMDSEGRTRQEIDSRPARWIFATGDCEEGRSGLLLLSYPSNYNYPELLRIWDENANRGRGDVFMNFAPTKDKDWSLQPDNTYQLRYRAISYDGEMTQERADQLWHEFTEPPVVTIYGE